MQTRTCPRCSSWFSDSQIDGEFSGICPKCLAAALLESHAGASDVVISNAGVETPTTAAPGALRPGERFGGFEILGVLGQGGMGVVYKARQTSLDRVVALKVLAPRIAGSEEFARRFDHEAKVLAAVNHPNVVQVHDFGRQGDVHYLVMEFVDGESLEHALRRGRMEPARLLGILRDVARGLGRVHNVGLVHRDLKPANILIARDGTAKIGDFGLAVESQGVQRLTEQGYFVGSPLYVSPEHAKGEKVDPRSDLYAVGIMLFEGFEGRPPFQAPSPTAVLVKHIEAPVPPLGRAPREVETLARLLLQKDPADRPASAAELELRLDRLIAAPPSRRRAPVRIAIAAAAAVMVSAMVAWFTRTPAPSGTALPWLVAAQEAVKAGDDEAAHRAVRSGLDVGDQTWTAQLHELATRIAALKADRPARQDDEEYGAFLCFSRGDWDRGLPLIAAGDASPWRELARQELSPKADPAEMGEGWLAAAAKAEKPRWAERMRERAWAWFSAAGATQRLAELDKILECRREIDLLALANPGKFSVAGEFRVEKGRLYTPPSTATARMSLPYLPPDDFDLSLEIERRSGEGAFYVGGPGFGSEISGNPRKVSVSVRRGLATATSDGNDLLALEPPARWRMPEPRLIVVGSDASAFVISRISLRACPPALPVRQASSDQRVVDLLSKVDPKRDGVSGSWKLEGGVLLSDTSENCRLELPYQPPEEYDFRIVFTRREGAALDVYQILSQAGKSFMWVDGGKSGNCGFGMVRGKWGPDSSNPTYAKVVQDAEPGVTHTSVVQVRKGGVQAYLDGRLVSKWKTDYSDVAMNVIWKLRDDGRLGIGTYLTSTAFHSIQVVEITGTGKESAGGAMDLLARVRPARDSVKGEWKLVDGALVSPATPEARIELPVEVPAEYDLVVTAERRSTDQRSFHIGLPIAGRGVLVTLDGFGTDRCAFENLDGQPSAGPWGTYLGQVFKEVGVPVTVRCEVRRNSLTVRAGDAQILSFTGDPARLELPGHWRGIRANAPLLGAFRSEFHVRKIELIPISGPARPLGEEGTDLLAVVDPVRDAVAGKWARSGAGIMNETIEKFPRLLFPNLPVPEYDLVLEAERKEGIRALIIGFTSGGEEGTVLIDGWTGMVTGLDLLDNKGGDANETTVRGTSYLPLGRRVTIIVSVRRSGVRLEIDGRQVLDWKGDLSRLSVHKNLALPRTGIFLAAWDSRFLIHRVRFVKRTGEARPPEIAPSSNAVDLVSQIDPARDAVQGTFAKEGTSLITPKEKIFSRIMIPVIPPQEYELTLEAVRRSGGDMIGLGILHDGRQVMAVVGGQSGETGGLEMLAGLNFMLNKTRFEHPFLEVGKPFSLKVTVRRSGIEAALNGKQVFSWAGDSKELSLYHEWRVPDRTRMFVASQGSSFEIRRLVMSPLSESASVNLLPLIDVRRDAIKGAWERDGETLRSTAGEGTRIELPIDAPEEYDLTIVARRETGNDCIAAGLPIGGRQVAVWIDGFPDLGYRTGFDQLDRQMVEKSPASLRDPMLKTGASSTIVYQVRRDRVSVQLDGRKLLDFQGNLERLTESPVWQPRNPRRPLIGTSLSRYAITRAVLTPVPSARLQIKPAAGTPVDLLPLIDPSRDSIRGKWSVEQGRLRCDEMMWAARIVVPYLPPEEYDLNLEVERVAGGDALFMGLTGGGTQFVHVLDGYTTNGGPLSGFEVLDRDRAIDNESRRNGRVFTTGKKSSVRYTVRKGAVAVHVDGKEILNWRGAMERLAVRDDYSVGRPDVLFLGAWDSRYAVTRLELVPVAAPGKPLR